MAHSENLSIGVFIDGGYFAKINEGLQAKKMASHVNVRNLLGFIPEIIGRLPILTSLDPLDKSALRRILVEPKNAIIRQYKKMFELDGVKLEFTDDALDLIVEKAVEYKLGARGLRSIVETIMIDAMYDVPSQEIDAFKVDRDYVSNQLIKANFEKTALSDRKKRNNIFVYIILICIVTILGSFVYYAFIDNHITNPTFSLK